MDYAVISLSGRQYKVTEGQVFDIDRVTHAIGSKFETSEVLLIVKDEQVLIGQPYVAGAKVSFEVLENFRGEKIRVSKFKAKSRYRKTIGFRADLTKIKVLKISKKAKSS
ncbi:MAG: 50S ribosomal protein L21 [Patescibacteria group bacterium]